MVVQMDHWFEEKIPVLSVYSVDKKTGASTACLSKGVTEFAVQWVLRWLEMMQFTNIILRTDQEVSVKAIAARARDSSKYVIELQEAPVQSHQAMGGVERYHRQIQELVRVVRIGLETSLATQLAASVPLVAWLVRHSSW